MAWTDPVRYPNPYEQMNNEEFLNTHVIDNLVDHQTRIVTLESGGGSSTVGCMLNGSTSLSVTADYLNSPANYVTFTTEEFDTSNMFDTAGTASQRQRVLIPETGQYRLTLENLPIYVDAAADVYAAFHIFTTQYGTTLATVSRYGYFRQTVPAAGTNLPIKMDAVANLTAGQSVAVGVSCAFSGTGTTRSLYALGTYPNSQYHGGFSVVKI